MLSELDRLWLPVSRHWRLNERHYGDLTGHYKEKTRIEVGDEQFMAWRRGYDTPPPPITHNNIHNPNHDPRYPSPSASHWTNQRIGPTAFVEGTTPRGKRCARIRLVPPAAIVMRVGLDENKVRLVADSSVSALDALEAEVHLVDARCSSDYASRRSRLRALDDQAKLFGPPANRLRCEIGKRLATMSAYVGDLVALRDWAEVSIAWAETVDEWGYCAEQYAMLAVSPLGSPNPGRIDALIRAHEIRSTKEMNDEQGSAVDNAIGAAFSNLGLFEEAQQRWQWSLDRYHEKPYLGVGLCALNLNDIRLYLLENPHLRDVDDVPPASTLERIDRTNDILRQNPHCSSDVVAALRCRASLLRGDVERAGWALDNVGHPLTSTVSWVQVLYAKSKMAQANDDVEAFVELTELLVAHLGEHPVFIHLEGAAQRLRLDALLVSGDLDQASALLRELDGRESKITAAKLATLFEWIRVQSEPRVPRLPNATSPRGRVSLWELP